MDTEIVINSNSRTKGITLVLIAATLWGISGTIAQYLFQQKGFSPEWLVDIRLLFSGLILLLSAYLKGDQNIWSIWKNKYSRWNLILFGIVGLVGAQYTYFAAIKYGNAATATILQYLGPVVITCYLSLRSRRFPSLKENVAIILALLGTFFLITGGNIHTLSISNKTLFWGITSAFALAFYTLHPLYLLAKWGSTVVVGWGMLIGGIAFSFIRQPWKLEGYYSFTSVLSIIFIVLFGTLLAFYCYLESTKYIAASETSLLACTEPLSAAFLSIIWLHIPFGISEFVGTVCIITTIIILSRTKK